MVPSIAILYYCINIWSYISYIIHCNTFQFAYLYYYKLAKLWKSIDQNILTICSAFTSWVHRLVGETWTSLNMFLSDGATWFPLNMLLLDGCGYPSTGAGKHRLCSTCSLCERLWGVGAEGVGLCLGPQWSMGALQWNKVHKKDTMRRWSSYSLTHKFKRQTKFLLGHLDHHKTSDYEIITRSEICVGGCL